MQLSDFLLQRIAEDEAAFEQAVIDEAESSSVPVDEVRAYWLRPKGQGRDDVERAGTGWPRYLAECEAKRRIVETRPAIDAPGPMLATVHETVCHQREYIWRCLALPYADHPDYDEAWRP